MLRFIEFVFNRVYRRKEEAVLMKEVHIQDGKMNILFEHRAFGILAEGLTEMIEKTGATNYLAVDLVDRVSLKAYTIIVQRRERPTQQEINEAMRAALTAIAERDVPYPIELARRTLGQFGYWPPVSK